MMIEELPRPIDPKDIRRGMKVRVEYRRHDAEFTVEFTAGENNHVDAQIKTAGDGPYQRFSYKPGTWTLLEETSNPKPALGSHWFDPQTGAEYVVTDDSGEHYHRYKSGTPALPGDTYLDDSYSEDMYSISRLVPVPNKTPKDLYPRTSKTVSECSNNINIAGYTCNRAFNHAGLHAAYIPMQEEPVYVWGKP